MWELLLKKLFVVVCHDLHHFLWCGTETTVHQIYSLAALGPCVLKNSLLMRSLFLAQKDMEVWKVNFDLLWVISSKVVLARIS